jgi:asparagine synthase (glutamine-hydrolysing)
VLAEPYRSTADAWAREWVDARIAAHAEAGRSWADADAQDAAFPREVIPPAGLVPEASPFLHEMFVAAALALPLGDRYHPGLPSGYLRCKAQVVRLLPASALAVLPRRKQYFKAALATASASGCYAPRCVGTGLLDGEVLAVETDPAVLLVVAALERWLAGAENAVAAVTSG